jgi:hypothetical protein
MNECKSEIKICEQTVYEFNAFNFMSLGGYKHSGVIRCFFETIAGIRHMSQCFPQSLSEQEAVDELIETAVAYRLFLNQNQEKP